jgi:hypothetical protein
MASDARTHRLYTLLQQLERARIHYTLARVREDTVMVCATVPGRRYEIEVFADGTLEVEVFGGAGALAGEAAVDALLADYSDGASPTA